MASPSLAKMKPFVLAKADQYRPPAPPPLESVQVVRIWKKYERLAIRQAPCARERKPTSHFSMRPPGFPTWNGIARFVVRAKALDLLSLRARRWRS